MKIQRFLTLSLLEVLLLDYSNIALSQVVKKYDQFTNKTTISLTGKRASGKPIFYIWSQYGGQRLQEGSDSLEVGLGASLFGRCYQAVEKALNCHPKLRTINE
jgi:hypothetical protein